MSKRQKSKVSQGKPQTVGVSLETDQPNEGKEKSVLIGEEKQVVVVRIAGDQVSIGVPSDMLANADLNYTAERLADGKRLILTPVANDEPPAKNPSRLNALKSPFGVNKVEASSHSPAIPDQTKATLKQLQQRQLECGTVFRKLYDGPSRKRIFQSPISTESTAPISSLFYVIGELLDEVNFVPKEVEGLWLLEITTDSHKHLDDIFNKYVTSKIKTAKTDTESDKIDKEAVASRRYLKSFRERLKKQLLSKARRHYHDSRAEVRFDYFTLSDCMFGKSEFSKRHRSFMFLRAFRLPLPAPENDQMTAITAWLSSDSPSVSMRCKLQFINYLQAKLKRKENLTAAQVIGYFEDLDDEELRVVAQGLGDSARKRGVKDLFVEVTGPPLETIGNVDEPSAQSNMKTENRGLAEIDIPAKDGNTEQAAEVELSEKQLKAKLYGVKLSEIHKKSGLNIQDVADKMVKSRTEISRYLHGHHLPTLEPRMKLAIIYGEPTLKEEPTLPSSPGSAS